MSRLRLYTVFHLNLMYSSIEEERRGEVVEKAYWPLLRLARELDLPFGIEATALTLEAAAAADPAWLEELRSLCSDGPCEFVGSGYAQIIGPLVPGDVNAANLRLGNQAYQRMLGFRPSVALINEQAYAGGLLRHYAEAGFGAVVMEWDNPYMAHPQWSPEWRYHPQVAVSGDGTRMPLIWNKSIAFQKFQRYAHGEMELEEYIEYLLRHVGGRDRVFSLYGNDIEVFDFRPGRYHTEAELREDSEWTRLRRLFAELAADGRFELVAPSDVLELEDGPEAGHELRLETAEQPVPVKKQGKYNITRWAVTGRDDLRVNTTCHAILEGLRRSDASDDHWRELCYLWSSDFRTHITPARWNAFSARLAAAAEQWAVTRSAGAGGSVSGGSPNGGVTTLERVGVRTEARYRVVETERVRVRLNPARGLAVDALWLGDLDGLPICRTIPHGYFDDIRLGADWYTGHLVLEAPGRSKVTDLGPAEIEVDERERSIDLRGRIRTGLGPVQKTIRVHRDRPAIEIGYRLEWAAIPIGSLRLGHVTLNPEALDADHLFYRASNGGDPETFAVGDRPVEHGDAVSFLVSAGHCLGMTDGWVEIGDDRRSIVVESDMTRAATVGLMTFRRAGGSYFLRLALSAGELDETRREGESRDDPLEVWVTIRAGEPG